MSWSHRREDLKQSIEEAFQLRGRWFHSGTVREKNDALERQDIPEVVFTLRLSSSTPTPHGPVAWSNLKWRGNFCNHSLCSGRFSCKLVWTTRQKADSRALETQWRCEKIFQNARNSCRNSHVILSCFMQPGPGPDFQRLQGRDRRLTALRASRICHPRWYIICVALESLL